MNPTHVASLLARELRTLRREIDAYPSDAALWAMPPGTANSGGTLVLHLLGNLQSYVGARLAGSDYVRDRDAEFARRDVPRAAMREEIDRAIAAVERLSVVDPARLDDDFPDAVGGWTVRTDDFLLHLVAHCAYHVGQLDYHRRLVTGDARGVGAVAIGELASARRA